MKKRILVIVTAIALCLSAMLSLAACDDKPAAKAVSSIAMEKTPDKTEYFAGETFSAEGGQIKVKYEDGTEEVIALTAEGVELSSVNMEKLGEKTIVVKYGGKRTTFKITVANQGFDVTFDLNYEGSVNKVVNVVKGTQAKKPANPEYEGHEFYNWFTDKACTVPYDFDRPVTGDLTVYAAWKEAGEQYFEVTYDFGYYGIKPSSYTQIVKSGENVKPLAVTPQRAEYDFVGWFIGESAFDPAAAVTAQTTITAKWNKLKTASSTYVFEAELTDLTGKMGPGFSGTSQEGGMIVANSTLDASGGKFVSFMYRSGNSLEFYIAASEAVENARLSVRLSAELDNIGFDSGEFNVIVNDAKMSYSDVSLVNGAAFSDVITIENVTLKQGANLIVLRVNNNRKPEGAGGTYEAVAPIIDCIKIETSAVLIWDANYGLPKSYAKA